MGIFCVMCVACVVCVRGVLQYVWYVCVWYGVWGVHAGCVTRMCGMGLWCVYVCAMGCDVWCVWYGMYALCMVCVCVMMCVVCMGVCMLWYVWYACVMCVVCVWYVCVCGTGCVVCGVAAESPQCSSGQPSISWQGEGLPTYSLSCLHPSGMTDPENP